MGVVAAISSLLGATASIASATTTGIQGAQASKKKEKAAEESRARIAEEERKLKNTDILAERLSIRDEKRAKRAGLAAANQGRSSTILNPSSSTLPAIKSAKTELGG